MKSEAPMMFSRRSVLVLGAATLTGGVAMATSTSFALAETEEATPTATERVSRLELLQRFASGYHWSATSPATRLGDTYSVTLTNGSSDTAEIWLNAVIMDHPEHHNETAVSEEITLQPGASRTLTASNEYGVANHFSTRLLANIGDESSLRIEISLVDADRVQTAYFNERAFWVRSVREILAEGEASRQERQTEGHHEGH